MKKYVLTAVSVLIMFTAHAQWLAQNAGFTNDTLGFYEMSLPNEHTAWAICYDGKNGLNSGRLILDFTRTTNGGATWIPGKMGNDNTLEFSNISAVSDTEAWVAMHKLGGITGGGLYQTKDGGISWTQSNPDEIFDANSFPDFVHFKDKNHGVAVGDPNGGYFEIYITNNGGKKWKRVPQSDMPVALPNEYGWISGYAAVGNTIWFGTTSGRMWKSVNLGKDWTVHTVDPAGKFINEIAFNDDMLHGVAHLRTNFGQTFLYSTADGGLTWTNLGQPAGWKSSRITAVPGTNALVATSVRGFDRGSSVSYDNGNTWTIIESIVPKAVARFYNAETGYAGSFFVTGPPLRPGIYKSQIAFQLPQATTKNSSDASPDIAKVKTTIQSVNIYPIPADDVVNISIPDELAASTSVINLITMNGKVIETRRAKATNLIQINVSKFAPGVYMLRIVNNNQTINRSITISR